MPLARLGIIFLHHDCNEVVWNNLANIRRQNPEATISTISAGKTLPGGYTLAATPEIEKLHGEKPAKSADWLLCSWFLQRKEKCRKWWVAEWDVFCTMPVREYYQPVWKFPFVASCVRVRHRDPEYGWFQSVPSMPTEYQPYAMGAVPFIYLLDEEALNAICTTMLQKPFLAGNGELRFATVANYCGYPPCGYSPPHDHIGWKTWTGLARQRTIYHPVKHFVNPQTLARVE